MWLSKGNKTPLFIFKLRSESTKSSCQQRPRTDAGAVKGAEVEVEEGADREGERRGERRVEAEAVKRLKTILGLPLGQLLISAQPSDSFAFEQI